MDAANDYVQAEIRDTLIFQKGWIRLCLRMKFLAEIDGSCASGDEKLSMASVKRT